MKKYYFLTILIASIFSLSGPANAFEDPEEDEYRDYMATHSGATVTRKEWFDYIDANASNPHEVQTPEKYFDLQEAMRSHQPPLLKRKRKPDIRKAINVSVEIPEDDHNASKTYYDQDGEPFAYCNEEGLTVFGTVPEGFDFDKADTEEAEDSDRTVDGLPFGPPNHPAFSESASSQGAGAAAAGEALNQRVWPRLPGQLPPLQRQDAVGDLRATTQEDWARF